MTGYYHALAMIDTCNIGVPMSSHLLNHLVFSPFNGYMKGDLLIRAFDGYIPDDICLLEHLMGISGHVILLSFLFPEFL